ncbi:MAG TPA: 6-carboxytetrahydropterin synthase QueD [Dehalococcoidales bacterium]
MYEIVVEQQIESAHYLRGYKGKCENVHGHTYGIIVRLKAAKLNEIGLVYDFTDVKRLLDAVLDKYDHKLLNDIPPFDKINPSAENIAATVSREVQSKLVGAPVTVKAVEVWENTRQGIVFTPD